MEKLKPYYTIGGSAKWAAFMENSMEIPQKINYHMIQ